MIPTILTTCEVSLYTKILRGMRLAQVLSTTLAPSRSPVTIFQQVIKMYSFTELVLTLVAFGQTENTWV